MTISYNWLCEYLPANIEPEKLSKILTSIGLEVESLERYQPIKGGLQGVVVGQVLTCEKHPDADKLKLTTVDIGSGQPLDIVCGAPNVAAGQKVVVATIGTTIYPISGEPITMKKAKIRGQESMGMICAEDELGLGKSHDGIIILPNEMAVGTPAADYFKPYEDWIFEIGLTANRMDAMSHMGVAKDVCAWLSHHERGDAKMKSPFKNQKINFTEGENISVKIENTDACKRYGGILINGVSVGESPKWLQEKLQAIGQRCINNIVDITNYILHETGQPLHAFDADKIAGKMVLVKCLPQDTLFTSLDAKERKLHEDDLMICDAEKPMCIGGVFGGLNSGVSAETKNIFLESAWFSPTSIRKTSVRHGLRTDAATRFEKGVDISQCINVLKRAASLVLEAAGGVAVGQIIDEYPVKIEKKEVGIKYQYLKKLSGKNYHADTVKDILQSLGFELIKDSMDELWLAVPHNKPDISLPADIVEEVMRIDGLDNVEIPASINMSPANDPLAADENWKEKLANQLVGLGFCEIFTNSITNSQYYNEVVLASAVKMMNNLSVELDVLRPSMMETGLESVAYNINRKNSNLRFFEFGKTYQTQGPGQYDEEQHLAIFITGKINETAWEAKEKAADYYYLKGVVSQLLQLGNLAGTTFEAIEADEYLSTGWELRSNKKLIGKMGVVATNKLKRFDIKQPVFYADILWQPWVKQAKKQKIQFAEIPKFPAVERDLAIVVSKEISFGTVEEIVQKAKPGKLIGLRLFDIFEGEKLGVNKKSLAINFTFQDHEKTMTDKEIETSMNKIKQVLEKEIGAEVRK